MSKSRTHAGRSVVVVDVVVFVAVALAGVITVGHGHGHDLLRLSQECGTGRAA
jgi:hypothetical protein